MTRQLRKVSLGTGASSGIGRAAAYAFARDGYITVLAVTGQALAVDGGWTAR